MTHSIPDCCGLIMRSEHGTIVHTGDWKIDETPVDGLEFDRTTFEKLGESFLSLDFDGHVGCMYEHARMAYIQSSPWQFQAGRTSC